MMNQNVTSHEKYPDPYHGLYARTVFGFWIFILTDFVLFGVLFACFAVLRNSTFGGPGAKELLSIDFAIVQSCLLLLCSFVMGLAGASAHRRDKQKTMIFLTITFLLGLIFMYYEYDDLARLIQSGNDWKKSAFLSAFFTLIGTHGIHVILGLMWIPVLMYPLVKEGIDQDGIRRITCLRLFWQFLNIVWVFIFAIVYFMGRG